MCEQRDARGKSVLKALHEELLLPPARPGWPRGEELGSCRPCSVKGTVLKLEHRASAVALFSQADSLGLFLFSFALCNPSGKQVTQ